MNEDIEAFFDAQAEAEMVIISNMIKRAEKEGLLCEVIWTLAQNNTGSIAEKCLHALHQWDC